MSASVDKNTVCLGDAISLQVDVSGDTTNIPKPQLPELVDFNVCSSGTSQNISFINGAASSSVTYNFTLSPNKEGKFTIGPVKLNVGGKTYTTEPISIEVVSSGSSTANSSAPPSQQQQQPHITNDENRNIFVTAEVDKKTVYVDEGLTYIFRFFAAKNLLSQPQYQPPNFTGFMVEDLPSQRNYQTTINGKRYNVIEIKSKLFPTASGKYNLGCASLNANVEDFTSRSPGGFFDDDFFRGFFGGGKVVTAKSKSITVDVLPLPVDGKPSDFSGVVGKYKIIASVDKPTVEANNPITLLVEISGTGNIKSISQPKIPNIIGVRIYDTISSINISKTNGAVSGSKTFKTAIIPQRAGTLIIPGIDFSYFNPTEKKYIKEKTQPIEVHITQSKATPQNSSQSPINSVNIVGEDIRFIKTSLVKKSLDEIVNLVGNILVGVALFLIVISIGFRKYTHFNLKNYSTIKSKKAYKVFLKNIRRIRNENTEKFFADVHNVIIKYLSDKVKINLNGLTFSEIEGILSQKLSFDTVRKVREMLDEVDFMRFAPSAGRKNEFVDEMKKIESIICEIEKEWK